MIILVTGSGGFIGRNLLSRMMPEGNHQFIEYDIGTDFKVIEENISDIDFIVHLAGVNRPETETEFYEGNAGFTDKLLEKVQSTGRKIPVLMSSSIQASLDNPYGKSKKMAEDAVLNYGRETGADVYVYRLPNVFGKWCRPNYNSVVATFCHNLSRGLEITVNDPAAVLNLTYIDDVTLSFEDLINGRKKPPVDEDGYYTVDNIFRVTLGDLTARLELIAKNRQTLVLPDFSDLLNKYLYATFTTYLPEESRVYELDMKRDQRGWLAEFIKSEQMGQIFISRTKPGITRGNHYHETKVEKFLVIQGKGVIAIRNIHSNEIKEYPVDGETLRPVDIPAGCTHSIENMGNEDMITLFWSAEMFHPEKPDTVYMEVSQ